MTDTAVGTVRRDPPEQCRLRTRPAGRRAADAGRAGAAHRAHAGARVRQQGALRRPGVRRGRPQRARLPAAGRPRRLLLRHPGALAGPRRRPARVPVRERLDHPGREAGRRLGRVPGAHRPADLGRRAVRPRRRRVPALLGPADGAVRAAHGLDAGPAGALAGAAVGARVPRWCSTPSTTGTCRWWPARSARSSRCTAGAPSGRWPLADRASVAAVLLGLGFALKLYPGAFVLPLALYVLTASRPGALDWRGGAAGVPAGRGHRGAGEPAVRGGRLRGLARRVHLPAAAQGRPDHELHLVLGLPAATRSRPTSSSRRTMDVLSPSAGAAVVRGGRRGRLRGAGAARGQLPVDRGQRGDAVRVPAAAQGALAAVHALAAAVLRAARGAVGLGGGLPGGRRW